MDSACPQIHDDADRPACLPLHEASSLTRGGDLAGIRHGTSFVPSGSPGRAS